MKKNRLYKIIYYIKNTWSEDKKYVIGLEKSSIKDALFGVAILTIAIAAITFKEWIVANDNIGVFEVNAISIIFIYCGLLFVLGYINGKYKFKIFQILMIALQCIGELIARFMSSVISFAFKKASAEHIYRYWTEVALGFSWALLGAFIFAGISKILLYIQPVATVVDNMQGSFSFILVLCLVIIASSIFKITVSYYFFKLEKMSRSRARIMADILIDEMRTMVFFLCMIVIVWVIAFCPTTDILRSQYVNVATVVVLWGSIVDRIHGSQGRSNLPLLSVVIPIWNTEPYLRRCLDSVINQSYTNLEIICVNDGSTDNSLNILEEYAREDTRIRIINKPNGGLVSARKAGVAAAKGDYITQVDSDDYIAAGMYEHLMNEAIVQQVDVVTSGLIRDYGERIVYEPESASYGFYSDQKLQRLLAEIVDTDKFYKANISLHVTNKIYRTEVLKKYQASVPDEVTVGDDAAVVFPLLYACNSIYVSGTNYYHYCIRPDSIMGSIHKGDDDPLYTMLGYIKTHTLPYDDRAKELFQKQMNVFSLYVRLLRNPAEVIRFENGYLYPFGELAKDDTIILFGAGKFGVSLKRFLDEKGFENIIWVDENANREGIITWKEAKHMKYDKVIAGALIYDTVENMRKIVKASCAQFLYAHLE